MDIISYDHADTQAKRITGLYYAGESAPANPELGTEWSVPSTGKVYKRINDGTNDIWIDVNTSGAQGTTAAVKDSVSYVVGTPSGSYDGSVNTFPVTSGFTAGQIDVYVEGFLLNKNEYNKIILGFGVLHNKPGFLSFSHHCAHQNP